MEATDATSPQPRRDTAPVLPGIGISLVVHALLLAMLGWATWAVITTDPPPERVITLGASVTGLDASSDSGDAPQADAAPRGAEAESAMTSTESANLPPALPLAPPTLPAELEGEGAFRPFDPALASLQLATGGATAPAGGAGLLAGTSGEFQDTARGLGRRGLDVVLVIDATQSMEPFTAEARDRLHDVIAVLTGILRGAGARNDPRLIRFGVVAFKDYGDDFGLDATKVLPLTSDADAVRTFIDRLPIGGGGLHDEPTHRALQVAADARKMGWQRDRSNLILLVSDAPVHLTGRDSAPAAAAQFAQRFRGTVSAIDVGGEGEQQARRTSILPDFLRIAEAGHGSAFLLTEKDRFWTYLLTSVFGERFAQDVDLIVEKYAASQNP